MGMAASQARYLALTARKTNVEYEGQQINQARTALSNQSANTFNDLLALEVPTAPSTQDYTELVYSYEEGLETETITGMAKLENDPDGYNYMITHYHYADIYTGIQNKLANPQVVENDTSVKGTISRDTVTTVQEPTYTVNGNTVTPYDPTDAAERTAYDRITADYPALSNTDISDLRCYVDANNVVHFTTKADLAGGGDINDYAYNSRTDTTNGTLIPRANITETAPQGDLTYAVNGKTVSKYDPNNAAQKNVFDKLSQDYPSLTKDMDDLMCYTDDNGTIHFTTQSSLEGTGDPADYYVNGGAPTYVGNCQLSKYNPNDSEQKSAYEQILQDWPDSAFAMANPDDIYVWTFQNQTRFACGADLTATAISGPDPTHPTENQDKLTYYVAQPTKTKIERTERARVDLDQSGRPQSVKFEDSSAVYPLSTETITDDVAYQDAMNQYNYNMEVYEKKIQDINAKTKKIQEQDRTLELRLRQLDTEQEALQTEMEAVKKVIDKNIETTFKTFE